MTDSVNSYETQVGLVRNAWSDLFILGVAQCAKAMNLQSILTAIVSHLQTSVAQEKVTAARVKQVTTTICKVQEYVRAMNRMKIQDQEFAYLKAIALFGTGTFSCCLVAWPMHFLNAIQLQICSG